jgi:ribosomal protein L24
VLRVYRQHNKVLVKGINVKLLYIKGDQDGEQASGTKATPLPIHYSKVNLIDPES